MNDLRTTSETRQEPFIALIDEQERRRRHAAALALIDGWADDEDSEADQRETMEVLRKALGPDRIASNRSAFP